jgi:hypothetical protein
MAAHVSKTPTNAEDCVDRNNTPATVTTRSTQMKEIEHTLTNLRGFGLAPTPNELTKHTPNTHSVKILFN